MDHPTPTARTAHTLVDRFAETVARFPDRPAVSDDQQTLSYTELAARAGQLASELIGRGVGAEIPVGLYLRRGVDTLVAILGILKAGAPYVAVDSRYPDERRDAMLRASGARVVLATPGWGERLAGLGADVLEWQSTAAAVGADDGRPVRQVSPEDAASILFTSGSSGTPKAIVLEHRNLLWFAENPSLPALEPADRVAQISSVSFDAFNFEAWCTLAAGAELVVLPALSEMVGSDLRRELRRLRITAMLAPTMAVNHVLAEDRDAFAALRILHAGGDVLQPSACRDLLASEFRGVLVNLYGPTEGTTACTSYPVKSVPDDADSIPIGRPLDGATVYLLDADLRPVPPGERGQLFIGGAGVARGYLNAPDLTAEKFLPDPFAPGDQRMYATGDLAVQRADGLLEFLGRADNQVKIRGYRVEPAEVERVLGRDPGVREAAVLTPGIGQDRRLVAFVVPVDQVSLRALRQFAEAALPDFMVPSEFIIVSEIPATDHGKRDWAELRRQLEDYQDRRAEHVALEGEIEHYVAELWEELLAVEQVGAADDFFLLGGHSMLAFRVQRKIKRDLGIAVEFSDVLDHSNLRDLAAVIDGKRNGAGA